MRGLLRRLSIPLFMLVLAGCAAQDEVTPPTTAPQSPLPVETLLSRADSLAAQGDYRGALDALQRIDLNAAPAPLRARALSKHEDYLIWAICAAVNDAGDKGVASIAVCDFVTSDKKPSREGMAIADAVIGTLPSRTKVRVFTRKFIRQLLGEVEFTESLLADPKTRTQLSLAGVQALVCGTLASRVSARVVRIKDGWVPLTF